MGPWLVVSVVGEVDLATAPRFRSELLGGAAAVAAGEHTGLAVDLTDCALIDSVGLGVLVGAARRARSTGAAFAVAAGPSVRTTFSRTRLDEIIDVVDTVEGLPAPG